MTGCRTVQELMEQARDERLPPLVQAALDNHLGSCPDCARLSMLEDELSEGLAALRAEGDGLALPSNFRQGVKERLLASDRSPAPARAGWATGFTMGLSAAACLALVAVAIFAKGGDGPKPVPAVIAATGPGSSTLPGELATSLDQPARLDWRTAPLIYSNPEVEVIFDGARPSHPDPHALRPAAAAAGEFEPERESERREYHF